ncbi:MAG: hypothetical protein BWY04_00601 [candidate division CPR1 bacterium ADurb.Bin160]|uniref:Uncharacterized protein n=1 Tax=candidate division CPR1 bacterium ADurb.Bin160 TaxID=1852826 RepID=A0A1V5ZNK3_9BACT|nr:MAG: hypothetical protein BWY04_00601 [candidate division CPR1 bacterium ADurb.Bin160]
MSRIYEGLGGGFTPNNPALLRDAALEQLPAPDKIRFAREECFICNF